jgi:hypothetical protein
VARFPFAFSAAARAGLRPLGITPANSWVEVGDGRLVAKFGRWVVDTPLANVARAEVTGPYRWYRALGLRLSLSDHGLTFGSNAARGVCIEFREPVKSVTVPRFVHPSLTVTVDRPDDLVTAIERGIGLPGANSQSD